MICYVTVREINVVILTLFVILFKISIVNETFPPFRETDDNIENNARDTLCLPVKALGRVIGAVEMLNKFNNENFDHDDEIAFGQLSPFIGLCLYHGKIHDESVRKEQRYRVAIEILSYHNTCTDIEVRQVKNEYSAMTANIKDFNFDPFTLDDLQKCKTAVKMFEELFGLANFDLDVVTKFILTVKKNYRVVPYHNFGHGWSVAQAMYVILCKDSFTRYNFNMRLALFVSCLCHDLDHRGYTNKYMNWKQLPLAAMYASSPLEHHHFSITLHILQQDGHNIFSHLTKEDYKDVLMYMRHCILATDIDTFFPNRYKFMQLYENQQTSGFDWNNGDHSKLAMALSMTAADLSASVKPSEVQMKTVKIIFEEFYIQGDKERDAGETPIPMMDRHKPEAQLASQIGFLRDVCVPCYDILRKILPNTEPMYEMAVKNLNTYLEIQTEENLLNK